MNTPIGVIEIQSSVQGITNVIFSAAHDCVRCPSDLTDRCKRQLNEYFDGTRRTFDVPLDQRGTAFQQTIWACLKQIPYGQIASYQDVALMANTEKAVRAVGTANGKNPIAIIVPCHRVIGKDGTLRGYAGGEDRKLWLLRHEGAIAP